VATTARQNKKSPSLRVKKKGTSPEKRQPSGGAQLILPIFPIFEFAAILDSH
jgi:hypothetical protein